MVVSRAGCTGRSEASPLNDSLSLRIVYAGICEAQDSGQAGCIILLAVAGTAVVHSACIQNKCLHWGLPLC